MFSHILLALAVSGQCLATHETKGEGAKSLTTAEFKDAFRSSGIVPEILPAALDPSVSFYAAYSSGDGKAAQIIPGSKLKVQEATFPVEFSVENLQNATNITSSTRYLIYMLDADAPSRSDPSARNFRHYLGGNFTLTGTNSSVLSTAQLLSNRSQPFNDFVQPNPGPNTGEHRYILALYVQPPRYNTAGFESAGMSDARMNWNLTQWRTQLGLGPAIGATYFTIETDPNAQSGAAAIGSSGMLSLLLGAVSLGSLMFLL
ncbi:phosphatidylethanolamine-binding protein [Coniochaeta sp. 2T2.1]|nr:phosphatidylethanolamine-binding protein [Coniochaeta sp. 2T2.1]